MGEESTNNSFGDFLHGAKYNDSKKCGHLSLSLFFGMKKVFLVNQFVSKNTMHVRMMSTSFCLKL
jgi:hypothetical protein